MINLGLIECTYPAIVTGYENGYGLFARTPIPKGTFLFHYTGEFVSATYAHKRDRNYMFDVSDNLFGYKPFDDPDADSPFYDRLKPGVVDAKNLHNLAAFVQEVPENSNDFTLNPERNYVYYVFLNQDIMTITAITNAQIARNCVYLDGLACREIFAESDIPAGNLIGISYGYGYWSSRKCQRDLFDKQGKLIDYHHYYPTKLYLNYIPEQGAHIQFDTRQTFTALLNKQGMNGLSFDDLKRLTIQHLGEVRFKAHFQCFVQKNPEVILKYRSNCFFSKNRDCAAGEWKDRKFQSGTDQPTEKLASRLSYFGFSFKKRPDLLEVDLDNSNPKIPAI